MNKNRCILIAGGASGVGARLALHLAASNNTVHIADKCHSDPLNLVSQADGLPGSITFHKFDIRSAASCEALVKGVSSASGRLDGFFNNAGIAPIAGLLDSDEDLLSDIFSVNVLGAILLTKCVVNLMRSVAGGSIVLVGSLHAHSGQANRLGYACSKAAILTLSKHVAIHYAADGVRSNVITPGWVATEGEIALRKAHGQSEFEFRNSAGKALPLGRLQEPEDLVGLVDFLLSPASKSVSGSNIMATDALFF